MELCVSTSEANDIALYLGNGNPITMESTLGYVYDAYGMIPSSKLEELTSYIKDNDIRYLGRNNNKDIFVSKSAIESITLNKEDLFSGNVIFESLQPDEFIHNLGIDYIKDLDIPTPEDLTQATEMAMYGESSDFEIDDFGFAMEDSLKPGNELEDLGKGIDVGGSIGNAGAGSGSGGGGIEDLTKTTSDSMGDSGGGDAGSDGDIDKLLNGSGLDGDDSSGEGGNDTDNMLDEDEDDDDEEDDGTKAKKRIRINMLKLHTIIKDSLDAMGTFTPAYDLANSRKYYKIQNTFNVMDEILLRIINEKINELTVEDLMKKYTTLCNIYDLNTRSMHAFAEEYKALSEKHNRKVSSNNKNDKVVKDSSQQ